jgi:hypothetical protein
MLASLANFPDIISDRQEPVCIAAKLEPEDVCTVDYFRCFDM